MKKYLLPFLCTLLAYSPTLWSKDAVLDECLAKSSDNRHTEQCIEAALARQDKRVLALGDILLPQRINVALEIQKQMRLRNVKKACSLDVTGTTNDYKGYLCLIHHSHDVLDVLEQKYAPKTKP